MNKLSTRWCDNWTRSFRFSSHHQHIHTCLSHYLSPIRPVYWNTYCWDHPGRCCADLLSLIADFVLISLSFLSFLGFLSIRNLPLFSLFSAFFPSPIRPFNFDFWWYFLLYSPFRQFFSAWWYFTSFDIFLFLYDIRQYHFPIGRSFLYR